MTPRSDIIAINVGTARAEVIQSFVHAGHSRLPLFEGSLETIVGVLHAKDVLQTLLGEEQVDLKSLARQPLFVSEDHYADDLLATFRHTGIHLALVLDESSQVIGLVTLEDLVEELVTIGDVTLEVVDMDGRRIDRVLISRQK